MVTILNMYARVLISSTLHRFKLEVSTEAQIMTSVLSHYMELG